MNKKLCSLLRAATFAIGMLFITLISAVLVKYSVMDLTWIVVYTANVIGLTWYLRGRKKAPDLGDAND